MANPTDGAKVELARGILAESKRLHMSGATRADLLYYLGRLQSAVEYALEVIDEAGVGNPTPDPDPQPVVPDTTSHTFVNQDAGHYYVCTRCGRVVAREDVWNIAVYEECGGGEQ